MMSTERMNPASFRRGHLAKKDHSSCEVGCILFLAFLRREDVHERVQFPGENHSFPESALANRP